MSEVLSVVSSEGIYFLLRWDYLPDTCVSISVLKGHLRYLCSLPPAIIAGHHSVSFSLFPCHRTISHLYI